MNRPALTAAAGLLALALGACSSSTDGSGSGSTPPATAGSTSGSTSTAPSGATSSDNPSDGSQGGGDSSSGSTGSGGSGGGGGNQGGGSSSAPAIDYARVECVVTGHETITGLGSVPTYSPRLTWKVSHATGMAISVDNPGLVGAYGTYGKTGSVDLGDGCYKSEKSHTVVFTTVGGTGGAATRTVHTPADKTKPTAPPFSQTTSTPQPSTSS